MNLFRLLMPFVRAVMKLAGLTPQKVEIEPGTTLNFWVPTEIIKKAKKPNKTMINRPSVVLLHGFFLNGIMTWFFQVLALASRYNVYVPDLLFFGDSITDKPDRSVSFQAECLAKGLGKLGVERCTVVGFSYGGPVGFKLAKLLPELVESMIMTGTSMELSKIVDSSTVNLLLPETIENLKLLISIGSQNKLFSTLPNFVYRDFLEAMYSNRKEKAELLKAFLDEELTLTKYTQKILLLWGETDKIVNLADAFHLKEQLGNEVILHYIPNAGHIVQIERPQLYSRHLKSFLTSLHN